MVACRDALLPTGSAAGSPESASYPSPMNAAKHTSREDESLVFREQVAILYRQAFTGLGASLVLATILLFAFRGEATLVAPSLWFGLMLLVTVLRLAVILAYRHRGADAADSVKWARAFLVGNIAGGVVWGLAGAGLFLADSPIHQILLAMVLAGITAGAAPLYAVREQSARLRSAGSQRGDRAVQPATGTGNRRTAGDPGQAAEP